MKNQVDYSMYKCPYSDIEKECGHELHGPEGYEKTYGIWCACGFRGPVFCLDPDDLKLEKVGNMEEDTGEGRLEMFEYKPVEIERLRNKYPKSKGIFRVGEELEIKGSLFQVKDISPFGIKLKLLRQPAVPVD